MIPFDYKILYIFINENSYDDNPIFNFNNEIILRNYVDYELLFNL